MVEIRVNGTQSPVTTGTFRRIADVVELVKTAIDPNHMITSILLNGNELSDADWELNPQSNQTLIMEFETGTPDDFVKGRVRMAPELVRAIYNEFRDARKQFQSGIMVEGNRCMVGAVKDLHAFLGWYVSLLDLVDEKDRPRFAITSQMDKLTEVCKRICQQQLYQSWWALGESLERELEPELDKLETFFMKLNAELNVPA